MLHEGHRRPPSPRVVVVDDDRFNRELMRDALESLVEVECCASAEDALAALARERADLVISDLMMPGLSGIELLERVRREHPGTDLVVVTGHASMESAIGALRMGAADYLLKPIQVEELALVVERILLRARLMQENHRLRDALRTADACRTLTRCLDASEVYAVALELLLQSLSRERGIALFRRGAGPLSNGLVFRGFSELEVGVLRDALTGEKPLEVGFFETRGTAREGALHDAMCEVGVAAGPAYTIPVVGREIEGGVFWVFEDGRPLDDAEVERAGLIADHAELALANAERYNEAKERAFIDDVTEVYNARYLLRATDHEIHRAERYGKPLTALFLDLDRFKLVNDEFGHLVGSRVLRQLSEVLLQCIRQIDTLARYGGDEFTILLPDTDGETGRAIAERIRHTVAEMRFEGAQGEPIRLTISIGVATYPHHGENRDTLLDQSDKAMYRAKSLGRDCVCTASELTS